MPIAGRLRAHQLNRALRAAPGGVTPQPSVCPVAQVLAPNGTAPKKSPLVHNRKGLQRTTNFVLLFLRNGECDKFSLMSNPPALLRSLLVYGLCLPLAVFLGYLLATPMDPATAAAVEILFFVMAIPLLLRWHHPWLIAVWNSSAVLFFLPGSPPVWMGLAAVSFGISLLQYTLNRKMRFLHVPSVMWPLLLLIAVILVTARFTGGFGIKLFGGDVYGGKRYFYILAAVLGYFAIINRRIPPERAGLYVGLFFLVGATVAVGDLAGVLPSFMQFLFVLFPVTSMSAYTDPTSAITQTNLIWRGGGVGAMGIAFFCAMLARYGIRGILDAAKPWRFAAFCFFILVSLATGFRSTVVIFLLTLAVLFFLERLHRTWLLLPVVLLTLVAGGMVTLFAERLPLSFQRSLAVLPFIRLNPLAEMDAEASSTWRLQMWQDVIPEIPQYLLVGKGYTFSGMEQAQIGNADLEAFELTGDYHNGPLSVLLPFGMFGAIAFVWLLVAGIRVVYHNYKFGDPAYQNINTFLCAYFIAKVIFFMAVFGGLYGDLPVFLGLLGLSISLNGGVAKPAVAPQPEAVFTRFSPHPSARRPISA
jgi:O-Antigen ligase